jgi:hypothetical protein
MYAVNQGGKEDTWCDEFFGDDRACMGGVAMALHAMCYGAVLRIYDFCLQEEPDEHRQGKWEGKQDGKSDKRITESKAQQEYMIGCKRKNI